MQLNKDDLRNVVTHLPKDIRKILTSHPGKVFVGGGFIRAVVGQEKISDIDMFGENAATLGMLAERLKTDRGDTKVHTSKNAITILTNNRHPVQMITRWLFTSADDLISSFDFTVCASAVYFQNGEWKSQVSEHFYADLAAKRLRYTLPKREEEAGGSMLRVIKYVKRGYSISPKSLAQVMARVSVAANTNILNNSRINWDSKCIESETYVSLAIQEKLREVDPLLIVDGLDVEDDHEMPDEDEDVLTGDKPPKLPVTPTFDDIPF